MKKFDDNIVRDFQRKMKRYEKEESIAIINHRAPRTVITFSKQQPIDKLFTLRSGGYVYWARIHSKIDRFDYLCLILKRIGKAKGQLTPKKTSARVPLQVVIPPALINDTPLPFKVANLA